MVLFLRGQFEGAGAISLGEIRRMLHEGAGNAVASEGGAYIEVVEKPHPCCAHAGEHGEEVGEALGAALLGGGKKKHRVLVFETLL